MKGKNRTDKHGGKPIPPVADRLYSEVDSMADSEVEALFSSIAPDTDVVESLRHLATLAAQQYLDRGEPIPGHVSSVLNTSSADQTVQQYAITRKRAPKELRLRLGMSQTAFGRRIGRTLNTVLRHESQIEPRGAALLPYAVLAIESEHSDLAKIFREAIIEDFGHDLEFIMSRQPGQTSDELHISPDMRPLVEAFIELMSAKNMQPHEELSRNSLKQFLLKEYSPLGLQARRKSGQRLA